MRISDWSSDVCSSDLLGAARHPHAAQRLGPDGARGLGGAIEIPARHLGRQRVARALQVDRRQAGLDQDRLAARLVEEQGELGAVALDRGRAVGASLVAVAEERSEEHTSELQSLMRISYAVFCLKKKKNQTHNAKIIIG